MAGGGASRADLSWCLSSEFLRVQLDMVSQRKEGKERVLSLCTWDFSHGIITVISWSKNRGRERRRGRERESDVNNVIPGTAGVESVFSF